MVLSIIRCVVFVYIHRPISRLTALPSVAAMLPKAKRAASTYVEAALLARLPSASGRGVYADFGAYIIPPMPPIPAAGIAGAAFSSFLSAMTHSVVRNIPAIEAAFSKATRVTLAGSITPAA